FSLSFFVLFFLFNLPLPPRLALFPYTTLFRSVFRSSELGEELLRGFDVQLHFGDVSGRRERSNQLRTSRRVEGLDPHQRAQMREDRKSTRLNSSHVKTSYAVFCLKKKTKRQLG